MNEKVLKEEILQAILNFIEEENSFLSEIDPQQSFDQLGIDSMGILRILLFLEDRYGINIPYESFTVESLRSIDSLANAVAQSVITFKKCSL